MKLIDWALAIALILLLSFIGGVLDGVVEIHQVRSASK